MPSIAPPNVKNLFQHARELCRAWPLDRPQFDLRTGWSRDYGAILEGKFERVLNESEILDSVLGRGRAIIAGRGGDGKTWLLRRLYMHVLDRGDLPILLDLKQWTGADYDDWKEWTENGAADAGDFLIRKFSGHNLDVISLDRIPPEVHKIVLVDGLNEITSNVGAQVLRLLDELARDQINLSVIVADRLIRRELPNAARWSIGTPLPLAAGEVKKHLGKDARVDAIFTCPFFLDAALRFNVISERRSQACQRFLVLHGHLATSDFGCAAEASFDAYRRSRSRIFDRARFARIAGQAALKALEGSKTVISRADGTAYFVHHILHDYLAARHVAGWLPEAWTPEVLAILSFGASSFDAVELMFEQLDEERADLFLRYLYDWNLYAAGYSLAQAHDADAIAGGEARTMIFAMLAEKRFDPFLATRQRADDALALMQLSDAKVFREARSLEAVFDILEKIPSDQEWFNAWRRLFQIGSVEKLDVETLATIRSPDSIRGWTAANVVKRSVFDEEAARYLSGWLQAQINPIGRWRIAHAFGAYPVPMALELLLGLLDGDPDGNVRYGAIRSIVELAVRSGSGLRDAITEAIEARAGRISSEPKVLGELRACLHVEPSLVEADWLEFVRRIVRVMFLESDNTSERDLWRSCLNRAEELYVSHAIEADGLRL